MGNSQAALAREEQALEIAERRYNSAPENAELVSDLILRYESLGHMQRDLGNSHAALALHQQGLEIAERLSNSAPENAAYARDLSERYNDIGDKQPSGKQLPSKQSQSQTPGSQWKPSEVIALYAVQSKTSVNTPDFWAQVSEALSEKGVFRSEEECQQRWFAVRTLIHLSSLVSTFYFYYQSFLGFLV